MTTPTPPVPQMEYVGKYTLSFVLDTGGEDTQTYYIAVANAPFLGFTTDASSALTFAFYLINGPSPKPYALQGINASIEAGDPRDPAWFLLGGLSTPNQGGEYPLAALAYVDTPPSFQCDISGGTTRLFVAAGNGYLQAQGAGPQFWVPPLGSFFDGARWTLTTINDWSQDDQTGADLSYVQFQNTVMGPRLLKNTVLTYANLSGVWFVGALMSGASLKNVNAIGAAFSSQSLGLGPGMATDFTAADFSGAYLQGALFQGCTLTNATLSGASFNDATSFADATLTGATFGAENLSGIDFSGAIMQGTKLSGANLANAKFAGADLTNADLSNSVLTGVDFTNATLTGTNLGGAAFDGQTKFTDATMNGTSFAGCDLRQAQFSSPAKFYVTPLVAPTTASPRTSMNGATIPLTLIGADWTWLDLTGATIIGTISKDLTSFKAEYSIFPAAFDLSSSQLDGANFAHATMHGARLEHSTAANANPPDFTGADLTSARMSKVTLRHANFTTSLLSGISLGQSILDHADFTSAHLETTGNLQADLSYCSLTDAIFTGAFLNTNSAGLQGANLSNTLIWGASAKMDSATIAGAVFASAYLADLDFQHVAGSTLEGTNFNDACLVNCKFQGTALTNVILSGACLQGANFSDATLYGAHMDNAAIDFSSGRLTITGNRNLPPFITYAATVITTATTNDATKCPNSDNGPCATSQWTAPQAPMTSWTAPPALS